MHWLIVDMPNNDEMKRGIEKMKFAPSGPPPKSGKHRYIFLLFEHDSKIGSSRVSNQFPRQRGGFQVGSYVEKNKLGNPIAVNFYYTEQK